MSTQLACLLRDAEPYKIGAGIVRSEFTCSIAELKCLQLSPLGHCIEDTPGVAARRLSFFHSHIPECRIRKDRSNWCIHDQKTRIRVFFG
ncbi:hypothetical protein ACFX1R_007567 [Malus domestica]